LEGNENHDISGILVAALVESKWQSRFIGVLDMQPKSAIVI